MEKLDIHDTLPYVTTASANVNILDPDMNMIDFEEIAMSLARQPRYTGHTERMISVGQHLLLCGLIEEAYYRGAENPASMLGVLLHDAHEAYLGDICRPLKQLLNDMTEDVIAVIEHRFDTVIYRKVGIDMVTLGQMKKHIKIVDNWALAVEVDAAFPHAAEAWKGLPEVPPELAQAAELIFQMDTDWKVADAWCNLIAINTERLEAANELELQ